MRQPNVLACVAPDPAAHFLIRAWGFVMPEIRACRRPPIADYVTGATNVMGGGLMCHLGRGAGQQP